MLAALILYLARASRFAIADSLAGNEGHTSSTLRPPISRKVKATWCSVRNAGWQQVKISRSRSSLAGPSSAQSSAPGPCDVLATAPSCSSSSRPRSERRRLSIARFRAVVTIHPAGLGGMPPVRHRSMATTNASWTASSASVMSPKPRIRGATAWPYTSRNTRSTSVVSRWAATVRFTSLLAWRYGVLYAPGRTEWAHFDRMVERLHHLACPGQGCIEVVRVDDVEPSDVLLRLGERPVRHHRAAIPNAHNGRRVGAMECATEDERTARVHLGF